MSRPTAVLADRILLGGKVLTVDARFSASSAVAIRGERILHVGSDAEVRRLAGPATEKVDLRGATVLPGLIDNHVHLVTAGLESLGHKVMLTGAASIAEIVDRIRRAVEQREPGKWVVTSFLPRTALTEGRFPTRHDLDPVSPENPVYLKQAGKNVICNSLALRLAGIDATTPDPPDDPDAGEGHIVHDSSGEPTGHLIAGAADLARAQWWRLQGQRPKLLEFVHATVDEYAEAIKAEMRNFNAAGITSVREMGVSPEEIDAYVDVAASGKATLRADLLLGLPASYMTIEEIETVLDGYFGPTRGFGGDWVTMGGLKVFIQTDGWWLMHPTKVRTLITQAAKRGFCLAFHAATGEDQSGTEAMLDALEIANAERSIVGRRFSLEHGFGTLDSSMWKRLAALGMTVATQPLLAYVASARTAGMAEGMKAVRLQKTPSAIKDPLERAARDWGFPIRSWLDAGLLVTCGTDAPAVRYDPNHPLLGMHIMCTQETLAGVLLPNETIGRQEAIRAMTSANAYAMFQEAHRGSIEPGKLADLIILSGDPTSVPIEEIKDITVSETIVGGSTVHERG